MLLSQHLHEAGCGALIRFPSRFKMIPDGFEHHIRGRTISFWFRKNIPSISSIILLYHPKPSFLLEKRNIELIVNLFVNGHEYYLSNDFWVGIYLAEMPSDHTFLFDLKLDERIKHYDQNYGELVSELDEALLRNEWIHVEVKLESSQFCISYQDANMKLACCTQIGITAFKEKSRIEEDVIFTNPY
ncbi:disease resistance-like protein [Trifolium medium]|uniref:Disease resistance-like protein n=1 Tax=Trifolium medium TaxID=97028 RepID=A0A392MW90_9FABA|nr:disease resistance-like protein [Trifolium medium]